MSLSGRWPARRTTDDVILIGHSLGGLTAPVVATRRPVAHLVYLNPAIPEPGVSHTESCARRPRNTFDGVAEHPIVAGDFLAATSEQAPLFYNLCSDEDVRWAVAQLRLQALRVLAEPVPITAYPEVPTSVILGVHDRLVDAGLATAIVWDWMRVRPIVLDSDHSPFLSTPDELARVLDKLARSR